MFRRFLSCEYGLPIIISTRNAGHSKWANIKHIKALKDGQRAQLFAKLGQKIKLAIFENNNNTNPDTNLYLQQAIEVAKKNSMPLTTIQNCIKQSQSDKSALKPLEMAMKGPKGLYFLVSALAPSPIKTKHELVAIFKKIGCSLLDSPVTKLFEKKGSVIALPPNDLANPTEASIGHAIETGAEEVQPTGDDDQSLEFTCDCSQLHSVRSKLEQLGYSVIEADFEYIPRSQVNLTETEMQSVAKIIEKVEDHPDVIRVYDNIQ